MKRISIIALSVFTALSCNKSVKSGDKEVTVDTDTPQVEKNNSEPKNNGKKSSRTTTTTEKDLTSTAQNTDTIVRKGKGKGDPVPTSDTKEAVLYCRTIDFSSLQTGEAVTDQFKSLGITSVTVKNRNPKNPDMAVIFDTSNPTGDDTDLQTPGYGKNNTSSLGKALIISERKRGTGFTPDDEAKGGRIVFKFDRPIAPISVDFLDIEEKGGFVELKKEGNNPRVNMRKLDDNSYQRLDLSSDSVIDRKITDINVKDKKVKDVVIKGSQVKGVNFSAFDTHGLAVNLPGSGALDNLRFCWINVK